MGGMKILAIETSCDETAIAVLSFSGAKKAPRVRILASIVSSQAALHAPFGGVVPNLARREHEKNLVPILLRVLEEAGLSASKAQNPLAHGISRARQTQKLQPKIQKQLSHILEREPDLLAHFMREATPLATPDIDAIAITYGPGLAPALWTGVNFARALSCIWHIPLVPVNHMEGHLYSSLLAKRTESGHYQILNIKFPALALLVSGGHTELVLMRGHGKYRIIGETLDDAAGEAFDKVARILGLGYPGGPAISAHAAPAKSKDKEFKDARSVVRLPRPMLHSKDYNFSFSGLKTAVLYLARDLVKQKQKNWASRSPKNFRMRSWRFSYQKQSARQPTIAQQHSSSEEECRQTNFCVPRLREKQKK